MFDWITSFVESSGYWGIALLMFGENLFPPLPSELIMPLAGYTAARGELNIYFATVAGSVGSLAGACFWYGLARSFGSERLKHWARRHGRLLTLTPSDVDQSCAWFNRHGRSAVFFGRLVPAVRTLISVPAGLAKLTLARFLIYSALGTVLWTGLLAGVGFALESQYQRVSAWLEPVANAVLAVLIVVYLIRVATFDRRRGKRDDDE